MGIWDINGLQKPQPGLPSGEKNAGIFHGIRDWRRDGIEWDGKDGDVSDLETASGF